MTKLIIAISTLIVLTSCSRLHPPDWLQGQWKNAYDSTNTTLWTIDKDEFYFRNEKFGSTDMIDITEIKENNRYILRRDHATEKYPIFMVFKLSDNNSIMYYDSCVLIPRRECILTKVNQTAAGNH